MTIQQIDQLVTSNNIDRVKSILQLNYDVTVIEKALEQYHSWLHDVHNKSLRPDKPIYDVIKNDAGEERKVVTGSRLVNRIAVPIQKQIVLLRSAFIGTPTMNAKAEADTPEERLIALIKKIWHDNKIDYRFSETTKRTMSELRCAWLWYNVEDAEYWIGEPINSKVKPKMKVLSKELGDELYPVYDDDDNMIAFGRSYFSVEYDENFDKVAVEHLDIYTAEKFYFKKKYKGKWVDNYSGLDYATEGSLAYSLDENGEIATTYKPNPVGKIPIIYFAQQYPEWADVQDACARYDDLISNHADTNDYFGNPILVGIGDTITLPQKGDAGKYVEIQGEKGDLKFVTWDSAPESIKMEMENTLDTAYDGTNTPRFKDFEKLGQMSGFAIQLRFLMPTLKAKDCIQNVFGEGVQRAYNYLKTLISVLDSKYVSTLPFQITPEFQSILPTDEMETITKIGSAITGGIMSNETGIEQNPLIEDKDTEKERIKGEVAAEDEREQAKVEAQRKVKTATALT